MFHDHEWEMELLPAALHTEAFYIGAMGSRATHRARVRQLEEKGIARASIDRIHGPAGLFSGSKSAGDIALSILAELVHVDQIRGRSRIAENDQRNMDLPAGRDPLRAAGR
jgi:xanthine dehydrogenase accessory factor